MTLRESQVPLQINAIKSILYGIFLAMPVAVLAEEGNELSVGYVEIQPEEGYRSERVYSGQTVASRASELGFTRGGEIAEVYVDLGDQVKAGMKLARLDTRSLSAKLHQAEAELALAKANIAAAAAQTKLAINTANRVKTLHEQGHASVQTLDETKLTAQARGAELDIARARLGSSRAVLEGVNVSVAESFIVAPFSGVIQTRYVDEGSQVQPAAPVLRLIEVSRVEARIGIPEHVTASLLASSTIHRLRWNGVELEAELVTVLPEVDTMTRTQTAVFNVAEQQVPIGSVVELVFADQVAGQGYWLPLSSLIASDRGMWGVYVVSTEDIVEKRLVEIVHTEAERVFVRGTLNASDRVVHSGVQRIVPGQRVTALKVADRV